VWARVPLNRAFESARLDVSKSVENKHLEAHSSVSEVFGHRIVICVHEVALEAHSSVSEVFGHRIVICVHEVALADRTIVKRRQDKIGVIIKGRKYNLIWAMPLQLLSRQVIHAFLGNRQEKAPCVMSTEVRAQSSYELLG
jgi:hypothetical protein